MPVRKGESAVVVPAPAAEPLVAAWRERFDRSAVQGMPAHITVLYPFLPDARLSPRNIAQLGQLCAGVPVFDVVFRRTGRFPGLLYLDPEPPDPLRALTVAIADRWPETPPYGGVFDDVIPHLTVAHDARENVLNQIEADVSGRLPLSTRLAEACLYVFDGESWRLRARLPFREARVNR